MKIIRPYMGLMNPHPASMSLGEYAHDLMKHIDWCGRVSHRSEDAPSDTERFLRHVVLEKGDWSIVEHSQVSVDAVVDRGITHEIVRHRIAAYTQESTRFVNYVKKMPPSFIYPIPGVECGYCLGGDVATPRGTTVDSTHTQPWCHGCGTLDCAYEPAWLCAIQGAEDEYRNLLSLGWKPQDARSVFPNALSSRIIITYNLRTWRHFFLMRTSKQAHPQMRQVTIPLLREFQKYFPVLYEDIEPESVQIENLRRGR